MDRQDKVCTQINLQRHFGGGEVYTRFLCQVLLARGWRVRLYVDRRADFWSELGLSGVEIVPVDGPGDLTSSELPAGLIVTHGPPPRELVEAVGGGQRLAAIAHMPVRDRSAEPFRRCHRVFAVSRYVLDTLRDKGVEQVYPEPLYGVADVQCRGASPTPIVERSPYDWDERKGRDRLLSHIYPWYRRLRRPQPFVRRPGVTLGIVSRITPIKQFPAQMKLLAPVMRRFPTVNLEIFGAGGYASVRDLRRALRPIAGQTRWWGNQADVLTVYRQLDYLLTGLPEKEALGLNVLEAQQCGTPVLAVRGKPFDETVVDGISGFFYEDPRTDLGVSFEALLRRLLAGEPRPDPRQATDHLQRFSVEAFGYRVERAFLTTLE